MSARTEKKVNYTTVAAHSYLLRDLSALRRELRFRAIATWWGEEADFSRNAAIAVIYKTPALDLHAIRMRLGEIQRERHSR